MPRKRTIPMQTAPPYIPEREGIFSMDSLLVNGMDHGELHRARVRAANAERQQRERKPDDPPTYSAVWLADQKRKNRLSGMWAANQAQVAENMARKREKGD